MNEPLLLSPQVLPRRTRLPAQFQLRGLAPIEAYFAQLDTVSPAAQRRLRSASAQSPQLQVGTVPQLPDGQPGRGLFMLEAYSSLGFDVHTRTQPEDAPNCSICLPLSGQMRVLQHGGWTQAGAGAGLLIDPRQTELVEVAPGTHFVEFDLDRQLLQQLSADSSLERSLAPAELAPALAQRLLQGAWQAADAATREAPPAWRRAQLQRWSELLGLELLLGLQPQLTQRDGVSAAAVSARLGRVLALVHARLEQSLSLNELAQAACVSVSALLRLFHKELGCTPAAYIRAQRLEAAQQELRSGQARSIKALAARWGFQSPSRFSQAYRARFGVLPTEVLRGRRA
ncbi:helix-turn-helix domain-containing protein [Roseateles sp. BYS180W]|uniref:Helix-turn-helix domain-containing protein n=1 Tax=Roseateles rivi TaxID=3299028 RepID=A0ABW7FRX3_9BURK